MDKFRKLKRLAEKCPIKRFKAFIGKANTQATLCADTGIEVIGWSGFDSSDLSAKSHRVELARFVAAADPETILALLAELEEKDRRIAELSVGKVGNALLEREKHHVEVVDKMLERITTVTEEREFWRERVEGAEKEREEFRRRFNLERTYAEDADKRITALDMRNAELNSTIERWATDRAESAQSIAELEAKLATPVRLPDIRSDDYHETGWFQHMKYYRDVERSLRAAGFTVGDE